MGCEDRLTGSKLRRDTRTVSTGQHLVVTLSDEAHTLRHAVLHIRDVTRYVGCYVRAYVQFCPPCFAVHRSHNAPEHHLRPSCTNSILIENKRGHCRKSPTSPRICGFHCTDFRKIPSVSISIVVFPIPNFIHIGSKL